VKPLIDIGLNLANKRFRNSETQVLRDARDAGVVACVLTGTNVLVSREVLRLCNVFEENFSNMLYCTAGVHPHHASEWNTESENTLLELLATPRVVAVGETGLDFNRNFSSPAIQEKVFEKQLALAARTQKPLFLHERDAFQRQHEMLRTCRDQIANGVVHCFTGNKQALFAYLDLDLHIGITGWICDERRGRELQEIVKHIPLNRLMLESDAPYLLPRTLRPRPANGRNEPAFLPWVLDTVAACRGEDASVVAKATTATAQAFFCLPEQGKPSRGDSHVHEG